MDIGFVIGWLFGVAISLLALYGVIRLAVTHALIAARPKTAPTATNASVNAPAATPWFNQG